MPGEDKNICNNHCQVLELFKKIDSRITEVWGAIDGMRDKMQRIEVKQIERIAKMEVQMSYNKWLIGLVIAQIVGLAFWFLKQ